MGISQKVILRKRENGKPRPLLQVLINREKREFSLGFAIQAEYWDEKHEQVKRSHPEAEVLNRRIAILRKKVNETLFDLQGIEGYTAQEFDRMMDGGKPNTRNFFSWVENELELMKPVVSINHLAHYRVLLAKLKGFRPNLRFVDLNPEFVDGFRNHLITEYKNHTNTIDSNMKLFKRLVKRALNQNLIKRENDPFRFYRSKKVPTNRTYLVEPV